MTTLTLRGVKGSPLTHNELDANFVALDSSISAGNFDSGIGVNSGGISINEGDLDLHDGDIILRHGDFKYNPRLAFHDLVAGEDRVIYDSSGGVLIGTDYNGLSSHLRVSRIGNQLVEMGCKTSNSGQNVYVQLGNAGSANGRSSGIKSTQTSSDFESWKLSLVAYNSTDGFIDALEVNPDGSIDVQTDITFHDSATFNNGLEIANGDLVIGGGNIIDGNGNSIADGTVTSIDVSAPSGFTSTGGPVTTNGTIALGYETSHSLGLPSNAKQGQWDQAYSWGDHSTEGYLTDAPSNGSQYARQDGGWAVVAPAVTYTAGNGLQLVGSQFSMTGSYTGSFEASGDIIAKSDIALKENVNPITDALEKVSQITGITFTRKEDGSKSAGVIAQEVQKVLPEVVKENEGTLGVAYGNLTGLLIEAVKELKAEIEELKKAK